MFGQEAFVTRGGIGPPTTSEMLSSVGGSVGAFMRGDNIAPASSAIGDAAGAQAAI
jgi:hypothetical protein